MFYKYRQPFSFHHWNLAPPAPRDLVPLLLSLAPVLLTLLTQTD
jgi:hypothetical protein